MGRITNNIADCIQKEIHRYINGFADRIYEYLNDEVDKQYARQRRHKGYVTDEDCDYVTINVADFEQKIQDIAEELRNVANYELF